MHTWNNNLVSCQSSFALANLISLNPLTYNHKQTFFGTVKNLFFHFSSLSVIYLRYKIDHSALSWSLYILNKIHKVNKNSKLVLFCGASKCCSSVKGLIEVFLLHCFNRGIQTQRWQIDGPVTSNRFILHARAKPDASLCSICSAEAKYSTAWEEESLELTHLGLHRIGRFGFEIFPFILRNFLL